jgi:uncharacterized protein DUF5994
MTSATSTRLTLKPDPTPTGFLDGGWWPRSRDLHAELPALLDLLTSRLGRVERVTYNLDEWPDAPRQISVDGSAVRLGGYRFQQRGSLDVIARAQRVTLLVVPPDTAEPLAHTALTAAAQPDNTDDIAALLGARLPSTEPPAPSDTT